MIRETLLVALAVGVSSCAAFKQDAKVALDIAQIACAIAHAETDDQTVAQVCGISDLLIPDLKAILSEQRKAVAAARKAGACEASKK